jgi:hypothetical protein
MHFKLLHNYLARRRLRLSVDNFINFNKSVGLVKKLEYFLMSLDALIKKNSYGFKNKFKQYNLQKNIENLYFLEYNTIENIKSHFKDTFLESKKSFCDLFNQILMLRDINKKMDQKNLGFKLEKVFFIIQNIIRDKLFSIGLKNLNCIEINSLMVKVLPEDIFNIIISSFISEFYDEQNFSQKFYNALFQQKDKNMDLKFCVSKTKVLGLFMDKFKIYLSSIVINSILSKDQLDNLFVEKDSFQNFLSILLKLLRFHNFNAELIKINKTGNDILGLLVHISSIILEIFESVKPALVSQKRFKSKNMYFFTDYFDKIKVPEKFLLPKIIPPSALNLMSFISYLPNNENLFLEIENHSELVNNFNLINQKKQVINTDFFDILYGIHTPDISKINLPIFKICYTHSEIKEFEFLVKHSQNCSEKMVLILREMLFFIKLNRTIFDWTLAVAAIFSNKMLLWYSNTFDSKLRMYPRPIFMSHLSGIFKYLLHDEIKQQLSNKGLMYLIIAYSYCSIECLKQTMSFLNKFKINGSIKVYTRNLIKYFQNQKVHALLSLKFEDALYFLLLRKTIVKAIANSKSKTANRLTLEQKASFAVYLSLLFKNKRMALHVNLLGGKPRCLYRYIGEKICKYLKDHKKSFKLDDQNFLRIKQFFVNRSVNKKTFLCFCSNQRSFSLFNAWCRQYNDIYKENPTGHIKNFFRVFSLKYSSVVYSNFKHLKYLFFLIFKFSYLVLKYNKQIILESPLEGYQLIYYPVLKIKRCFINISPFSKKKRKKVYKFVYVLDKSSLADRKVIRGSLHHKLLLKLSKNMKVYLIHFLGATVFRKLIVNINNATEDNYIVSHSHDNISFHPNIYSIVCDQIYDLFTSSVFDHLMDKVLFNSNIIKTTNPEIKKKLQEIQKKFNSLCQKFDIPKSFNPKNMFEFKGPASRYDIRDFFDYTIF